jgi:hypothetical protein
VNFSPRSSNSRRIRQKPARLPYSYIDSVEKSRSPTHGAPPGVSVRNTSDAGSPFRTVFSPPSS